MRVNAPLDWENLAEEVESLGCAQRNELGSRIEVIVEHLMKLQASPAELPRSGWRATVLHKRGKIDDLFADSPSLRNAVPDLLARAVRRSRRIVGEELASYGESSAKLRSLDYTEEQVLGDWLPD